MLMLQAEVHLALLMHHCYQPCSAVDRPPWLLLTTPHITIQHVATAADPHRCTGVEPSVCPARAAAGAGPGLRLRPLPAGTHVSGSGLLGLLPVLTVWGRGLAVVALVYGQGTPSFALGAAPDILCWYAARWLTQRPGHAPSHSTLGGLGGSAAWQPGYPS